MQPAELRVVPPRGRGRPRTYPLEGLQYSIGRLAPHHEPDIALDPDPQGWISRLHCILDLDQGQWWITSHGRNGTLLRHDTPGTPVEPLHGRQLLQHGDTLLILGDMAGDRDRLYWELTYIDWHRTRPAPGAAGATRPGIRYDWVAGQAYRVDGGTETLVEGLRPKGHQLLRYMVSRSDGRRIEAIACDHAELIAALWDAPEGGIVTADRTDLAGIVHAVRLRIEADRAHPRILETVPTIGYRLHVHPDRPRR